MLGRRFLRLASLEEVWRSRRLLGSLVLRQLKASYAGSVGGWAWVVLRPLMTVIAYYFVFDLVLAVRLNVEEAGTATYALYLISGMIPWLAFSDGVVQGTNSLVGDANLLKKTRFPAELIPARAVLGGAVAILPFTYLVGIISLAMGSGGALGMLLLLPWLGLQILLSYHIALVLSLLTAALRDIGQIVQTFFPMLIFFSPILFPPDRVPDALRSVLWLNPFTPLVNGYHSLLLQGTLPSGADLAVLFGWWLLLVIVSRKLLLRAREQLVDWL
jgi:lipopolysaccharide transport system permease protein